MKNTRSLLTKSAWLLLIFMALISLLLGGCDNPDLQAQILALTKDKASLTQNNTALQSSVASLTSDNGNLTAQVQTLKQDIATLQKQVSTSQAILKVENVTTAAGVNLTNGQLDWRQYTPQKNFPSGYAGKLWVMFSFSNMLHDKSYNIKADIYLISNGQTLAVKNKPASLTDTTDNTLWWGDSFDINTYPDGDYTVILTVTDVIAGTTAAQITTFKIGAAK